VQEIVNETKRYANEKPNSLDLSCRSIDLEQVERLYSNITGSQTRGGKVRNLTHEGKMLGIVYSLPENSHR